MAFFSKFRFSDRSPLTVVEFIVAALTIIGGLYLLSPLLDISVALHGASPLVATLANSTAIAFYGVFLTSIGAINISAIYKRNYKWRSRALFGNILIRLYGFIVTMLVQGPIPPTWLSSFGIMLIAIVCYSVVKGMDVRRLKP